MPRWPLESAGLRTAGKPTASAAARASACVRPNWEEEGDAVPALDAAGAIALEAGMDEAAAVDPADTRHLQARVDGHAAPDGRRRRERVLDADEPGAGRRRVRQRPARGPAAQRVEPLRVLRVRAPLWPDPDLQRDPASHGRRGPRPEHVLAVARDDVDPVDVRDVPLRPCRSRRVRPARHDVAPAVTGVDQVAPALPLDDVAAGPTDQEAGAPAAAQDVVAGSAVERVARRR